jgi:rubrerythrin
VSISVPQAIRNAIETERSAANFYRSLVSRARDANTASLLETMARDEEAHANQLMTLANSLAAAPLPESADDLAHLVESTPPLSTGAGISFVKALYLALDAEHHAAHFYTVVADATSGEVKNLFNRLAEIEQRHARYLERLLDETTASSR